MEIFGFIGIVGMLGSVTMSSYNSGKSSQDLRDAITAMNQKITDYKNNYIALLKSGAELNQKILGEMANNIDSITEYSKQIEVAKNDHARAYKSIQIAGVTILIYIAFIFILKIFGFYDVVEEVIVYPYKKILGYNNPEKS